MTVTRQHTATQFSKHPVDALVKLRIQSGLLFVVLVAIITYAPMSHAQTRETSPGLTAYRNGEFSKAIHHFKRVAHQGCMHAQYNVGVMYGNAQGVPRSFKRAAYWYERSAKQGKALAQFNLAVLYDNGSGVTRNAQQAVKLYRLAARQGHAHAQFNLSQMYQQGDGVPQDPLAAYEWLVRAATGNASRYEYFRDLAWQQLTQKQRRRYQSLARD